MKFGDLVINLFAILTLKASEMKIVEFAISIDSDEAVQSEPALFALYSLNSQYGIFYILVNIFGMLPM